MDFNDILIRPRISTVRHRADVNLNVNYPYVFRGVPIMAANMGGVGTLAMAEELARHHMFTCLDKSVDIDARIEALYTEETPEIWDHMALSVGMESIAIPGSLRYLCMDVANGYMSAFHDKVKFYKDHFPDLIIIAGNVATEEGVNALCEAGADIIKIGLGSGGMCLTRKKTGVGVNQIEALLECVLVADEHGAYIISDGGCRTPGDVALAFAYGADFVMLGSMLAGHQEGSPTNQEYVEFQGSSYCEDPTAYKTSEGARTLLKARGPVSRTLHNITGGLRSACAYTGFHNLQDFIGLES